MVSKRYISGPFWTGQEAPQATPAEPLRQEGNLGCHSVIWCHLMSSAISVICYQCHLWLYGHLHKSSQHFCIFLPILSVDTAGSSSRTQQKMHFWILKRPKSSQISQLAMKIYVLILGAVHAANNANKCVFPNEPRVPYYWDENCKLGLLRNTSVCHFKSQIISFSWEDWSF